MIKQAEVFHVCPGSSPAFWLQQRNHRHTRTMLQELSFLNLLAVSSPCLRAGTHTTWTVWVFFILHLCLLRKSKLLYHCTSDNISLKTSWRFELKIILSRAHHWRFIAFKFLAVFYFFFQHFVMILALPVLSHFSHLEKKRRKHWFSNK